MIRANDFVDVNVRYGLFGARCCGRVHAAEVAGMPARGLIGLASSQKQASSAASRTASVVAELLERNRQIDVAVIVGPDAGLPSEPIDLSTIIVAEPSGRVASPTPRELQIELTEAYIGG